MMASPIGGGLNGYDVVRGPDRIEILCAADGAVRAGVLFNDSGRIGHVAMEPSGFGQEAMLVLGVVLADRGLPRFLPAPEVSG